MIPALKIATETCGLFNIDTAEKWRVMSTRVARHVRTRVYSCHVFARHVTQHHYLQIARPFSSVISMTPRCLYDSVVYI